LTYIKIMSPVIPFVSDKIYQNLVSNTKADKSKSVHLSDFPKFSDELKNDKEVVLIAVSPDNGGAPAYRWASEELQKDPDVIAATKKGNLADDFDEDEGLYL